MFATYDRSGISFAYPDNWTLEEDSDDEARLNLTVTSPNTAFWTLIVYADSLDLPHVVSQAVEALKGEYPELETTDAPEEIAEVKLTGVDASFFYLDLTSTCRVRACHRGGSTYLILSQSEDRELKTAGPVFAAITQSLLGEAPTPDVD
ncbi:hypothetical protein MalM25_25940 [Planctomycetes bacterium MalM25]|nr:hypothetical protein MalM25_25940 [Planctomycetes bacterium MalM25]